MPRRPFKATAWSAEEITRRAQVSAADDAAALAAWKRNTRKDAAGLLDATADTSDDANRP